MEKLIFEHSCRGKVGFSLPEYHGMKPASELLPANFLRTKDAELPEVSEPEVVRHFTNLSNLNHHVDKDFYPLGSCTMKYNPKINDKLAGLTGLTEINPNQDCNSVQGALQIMYELQQYLAEITGMKAISLQPAAGSHGEFVGISIMKKYHEAKGEHRKFILVPDSAHGTNPSSVAACGFKSISVNSLPDGTVDIDDLESRMSNDVAGMMLTNPNTLGIFEKNVEKICGIVHKYDGLMYMDGANMNALLGIVRQGDMGFDISHLNLHKTFSTPHGGGGPGSGPVGVVEKLEKYLPVPRIEKDGDTYKLNSEIPESVGQILGTLGNFSVIVRAYVYIRSLGLEGLEQISRNAILNANYIKHKLEGFYDIPFQNQNMHEFVASGEKHKKEYGVKTLDIAKRLLDYGMHAPTVYFPLIVHEALMIEPTESESLETLDRFIDIMLKIDQEAKENPELLHNAPVNTPVGRLDEVKANKEINCRYKKNA